MLRLGDQRHPLDRLDERGLVDPRRGLGARSGTGCGPWGTRRRAAGSWSAGGRRGRSPRSRSDPLAGAPSEASAIVTSRAARSATWRCRRAPGPGTSAADLDTSGLVRASRSSSRRASRNRSVASSEMPVPSISIRTPVSTGSMSSRPAAVTAWVTAWANTSLVDGAGGGRHLRQRRVVLDRHRLQAEPRLPQIRLTRGPSRAMSTGWRGRLRRCRRAAGRTPGPCPRRPPRPDSVTRAEVS